MPFGVNYYRPDTGWAPQLWKQFDAATTRRDFDITPAARDVSQRTGLLTATGKSKAWAREFRELVDALASTSIVAPPLGQRPKLDWDRCITDLQAGRQFRRQYAAAFLRDHPREDSGKDAPKK